ncbi:MAG: hypothetical protein ABR582_16005 [Gemmatimonadaceae bacterium]
MSTKLASVFTIMLALLSGALAWEQQHKALALTKQVASLSDEVAKKDDALHEQTVVLEKAQEENRVYNRELASLREKVSARPRATTTVQDQDNNSTTSSQSENAKYFSKMAKDPILMEVARQWHVARIKKIYRDFVQARHLSPQQTKQFFDLLGREDGRTREESANLLSGDTGTDAKEAEAKSAMAKEELERQLKLLLGGDYAEYQEYNKSAGPRSTLIDIQEHFAKAGVSLRADQTQSLLETLLDEHSLDQSVLDRMETVLTAEQHKELERFREESMALRTLRSEAANEMMKRNNKTDAPAPTPPY